MIMTDSASIQDVLFFPQMRPEKKSTENDDSAFIALGVPAAWIPHIRKLGFGTVEQLNTANPNKLANDLNGLRKKNKMDTPALNPETVKKWVSGISGRGDDNQPN